MRKVNKFHQSRPVSACRQKLLPYRVRYQCRNTLPQYPVIVKYRHCSIISLPRQFMLAARHRKNVLCTSLHCIIQCIIRCCVTCVKRYHHIDCLIRSAVRYISRLKMQIRITVFLCKLRAEIDNILLQIDSCHLYGDFANKSEIIIHDEREI